MSPAAAPPLHASLIAAWRAGAWRGVLLRGPSGAGKSGLALRALAAGWALVADDRVRLWTSGGEVYGRAPEILFGLVEVRGQGVVRRRALPYARVVLSVQAATAPGERVPEPQLDEVCGVALPGVRLMFGEPGAVARLDLALDVALRRSTRL